MKNSMLRRFWRIFHVCLPTLKLFSDPGVLGVAAVVMLLILGVEIIFIRQQNRKGVFDKR